jgi:hypothetical protein
MTEEAPQTGPEGPADPERAERPEVAPTPAPMTVPIIVPTTGVAAVDRVLGELDHIDERPLEEHLEAFEGAHSALRAALDSGPDDEPSAGSNAVPNAGPADPA